MLLHVDLGERAYPIHIANDNLANASLFAALAGRKLCIVTNTTVAALYLEKLQAVLPQPADCVVVLPDGEQYKNMQGMEQIFDAALQARLNRSSVMIALGGGVVGDMTGFAAACYQRGIDFVQLPTTLLAQVDSSVGGKTGINHVLGKNMIGAFHQPIAVIIDTATLKTLPPRELSAGLAEVIKYGLIADADFFAWLEGNMDALRGLDGEALQHAVYRSCSIKAAIVARDEKEGGIRAILNLGHTFGHAIETWSGYGQWLHGEAVAVGMLMAVDLSVRMGWLPVDVLERSKALIARAGLPLQAPAGMTVAQFLEAMALDKKNIYGSIRLVLLEGLGSAVISDDYDVAQMHQVIAAWLPCE
ncbi:MAG TPA: 3-dehydroquinate synthase [Pseudomonadales bacterium]